MSLLTLQNAVGICTLSRRWRSLWRTLPYLHFNIGTHSSKKNSDHDYPPYDDYEEEGRSFSNFITQFLARRCSSADLVTLRFCSDSSICIYLVDSSVLESLICYAVDHHVQQLVITAPYSKCIWFPPRFTSCQLLTTLTLEYLEIDVNGDGHTFDINNNKLLFPALHTLHLFSVRFNVMDQDFCSRIFSCTPNLQTLKLIDTDFYGSSSLSIEAPNLKNLEFMYASCDGSTYPHGFKVKLNTPNLTRFMFYGSYIPLWYSGCNPSSLDEVDFEVDRTHFVEEHGHSLGFVNPLSMFTHAKTLRLSTKTLQALLGLPALVESQLEFPNLKYLELRVNSQSDFLIPTSLLNKFLSNSPVLKIWSR